MARYIVRGKGNVNRRWGALILVWLQSFDYN